MLVSSCMYFNFSNTTEGLSINLKADFMAPSMIALTGTFSLAVIILVALASSQFYKSSSDIFYFNLSMADAIMAFIGILIVALPENSLTGHASFVTRRLLELVLLLLRYVHNGNATVTSPN